MLTPTYGMGDGFEHFDFSVLNVGHPHEVMTSQKLIEIARSGMRDLKAPYFVWVHFFDPHFAYLEHSQYAFGNTDIDRYDAEIAYTDYYIDELLKVVDRGNTVVVFTADHGEEFGEHDGQYHYTLHGEVMHVPMVVKAPGLAAPRRRPRRRADRFSPDDSQAARNADSGRSAGPRRLRGGSDSATGVHRARPAAAVAPARHRARTARSSSSIEDADISLVPESSRDEEIEVTNVHPGMYLYDLANRPGRADESVRARRLDVALAARRFDDALRDRGRAPATGPTRPGPSR